MKLYAPIQKKVIRIDIKGGKGDSKCITLEETNLKDVIEMVKHIFSNIEVKTIHLSTEKPKGIPLTCYEQVSGTKGKTKSTTIYGLNGIDIYNEIIRYLNLLKN